MVAVAQAFKGTLGLDAVAEALERGVQAAGATPRVIRGSDGGDGLLDAVRPPRRTSHRVTGPLGEPVDAEIGWLDANTALIESRMACGLGLIEPGRRDPARATTRGVGELIAHAARAGAGTVLVGLGGSASMDGGLGAARALGWAASDASEQPLPEGGGALESLAALEPGPGLAAHLEGLSDVRNPLLGPEGAAVFGPQKGAGPLEVQRLERGLARLVAAAEPWGGPAHAAREGAGAAGGLGFGLLCFLGGALRPGAAWVLDRNGLDDALDRAGLVIVAEALVDATSFAGKLTGEVVHRAARNGVPVALVTPRSSHPVTGVTVVGTPGHWSSDDIARHTERAVRHCLKR